MGIFLTGRCMTIYIQVMYFTYVATSYFTHNWVLLQIKDDTKVANISNKES